MQHIALSWKTTSAGLLSVLTGVIRFYIHSKNGEPMSEEFLMGTISLIIAGVGLIFSKDSNVTGSPARNVEDVTTKVAEKPKE